MRLCFERLTEYVPRPFNFGADRYLEEAMAAFGGPFKKGKKTPMHSDLQTYSWRGGRVTMNSRLVIFVLSKGWTLLMF